MFYIASIHRPNESNAFHTEIFIDEDKAYDWVEHQLGLYPIFRPDWTGKVTRCPYDVSPYKKALMMYGE